MSGAEELGAIATRLREIAERLRAEELPGDGADELAREAAELVSRAGVEVDRAADELDQERE